MLVLFLRLWHAIYIRSRRNRQSKCLRPRRLKQAGELLFFKGFYTSHSYRQYPDCVLLDVSTWLLNRKRYRGKRALEIE